VKHLLGEASPEEEQAVNEWMNENATNKEYYNQLKKIWDNSKELAADSTLDVVKYGKDFKSGLLIQNESPKILNAVVFPG
jgi:hypothetical protein